MENLRNNFGNASGVTSSGTKWVLSFTFKVVEMGGDVHLRWMTKSELKTLQKEYSKLYGSRIDPRQIVASTSLGSNTMLFNPLYKSISSIERGWGVTHGDATAVYDFTRGSFAHEFSHGAGMDHTSNSSKSMTSYAADRAVNGNDRARWCYLATQSTGCF